MCQFYRLCIKDSFSELHGTYNIMPPVEMLETLKHLYGLTVNEIPNGRKSATEEQKEMAESNTKETLRASTFEPKEKQEFF